MVEEKWIIIGISGVTCGGKTTLSTELHKLLPNSNLISQDDYFLDVHDERHVWIKELDHINYDIISSLDMDKMYTDILKLIKHPVTKHSKQSSNHSLDFKQTLSELQKFTLKRMSDINCKLLILEGFNLFSYKPIEELCEIKYFFTLSKDECFKRREFRVYEPPDCPGYFEQCVWPEYKKYFNFASNNLKDIKFFNEQTKEPLKTVLIDIMHLLH